jgi:hypothetical protein
VHKFTVNSASRDLVTLRDGSLFIAAVPTPADRAFPYAAGFIDTQGLFAQTYGKIEFRARCQFAPGVWYALWGRAWDELVPEIDIEFLGENTTQVWLVNHWGLPPLPADKRRGATAVNGMDITQPHTYEIEWAPQRLEWKIDGKTYRRVTDDTVPRSAMFWNMNAWVGGWGGMPSAATPFPAGIAIEHVRIQRITPWPVEPGIRVLAPRRDYGPGQPVDVAIADFDSPAAVEVREGSRLLATLRSPPFRFPVDGLTAGPHELTFEATDGQRAARVTRTVAVR